MTSRSLLIAALVSLALPRTARAELYTFVDAEGVIHFTNIPPGDPRYKKLVPSNGTSNTYEWFDEAGEVRRLHRVDVPRYDTLIFEAARYYSLPPALVKAVIAAESGFEHTAVSHAGARGLMQLIPSTAAEMHVRDSFDPRDNIFGGTRYLRLLANQFSGDLRLTLAAYNAGPRVVTKVGDVPRIPETQLYVRRVMALYQHYLSNWSQEVP